MDLDETIAYYKKQPKRFDDCGLDHEQLALWLTELKMLRKHTSLAEIEANTANRWSLHFTRLVFAMLKSIWASNNALNEEERFPKLSEKWKARAEYYRQEAEGLKNPEETTIEPSWLVHLLLCECDDGLKEEVEKAILETKEYIKNHPEE